MTTTSSYLTDRNWAHHLFRLHYISDISTIPSGTLDSRKTILYIPKLVRYIHKASLFKTLTFQTLTLFKCYQYNLLIIIHL